MTRELLLGVDIGTQSTRAALISLDGEPIAAAGRPYDLQTPRPGWAEQDPDIWWRCAVECIREVMATAGATADEVRAVGAGGQMHGTVPIAANGELLSHAVQLWCDKRCAPLVEAFARDPFADEAFGIAGSPPVANWFGFKIQWLRDNAPAVYDATWKFLVPKDFFNFRMTGQVATDYSEASGSYLMDAATCTWSDALVKVLSIDPVKLPDIHRSADVIGGVTAEVAALTGLALGTPVVAGGGDMLCTLLAAGLTKPGEASDNTGTSSILSVFTDTPVYDRRLMNLHHVTDGWIPFGIADAGGVSLKWFKDNYCQSEVAEAAARSVGVYDILNREAAEVAPGCEGLIFFPYLMGERTLGSPYARAVFFGLSPRHGVGATVRAIMEGVTFELRQTLEIVEGAGHPVNVISHTGGGAYSQLWSQIKADIYGKPVITFENTESGLLGAAILAGAGAALFADEREGARRCLRVKHIFEPDSNNVERYARQYELFKDLHARFQEPFSQLPSLA
jgi:xylulokinase